LVAAFALATGTFFTAGLAIFLGDFLDIRLPFVAFSGSVLMIFRMCWRSVRGRRCGANRLPPEYGYKGFDATPDPRTLEMRRRSGEQ
jgi:predicted MFS family arabinose efflux permease